MRSSWDRRLLGHISTVYPIYYFYEDGKNISLLNLFIPLVNFVFLTLYFVIKLKKVVFYCLYCFYCLYPLFSIFKFQFKKRIFSLFSVSSLSIDSIFHLFRYYSHTIHLRHLVTLNFESNGEYPRSKKK